MVVVELNREILDRENYDAIKVVQDDMIELDHIVLNHLNRIIVLSIKNFSVQLHNHHARVKLKSFEQSRHRMPRGAYGDDSARSS